MAHLMAALAEELPRLAQLNQDTPFEPFLNLTRDQCHVLLALYHAVDPELEKTVHILFPEVSKKLVEDYKERNTVAKKLERAPEQFLQEYLNLQQVQKAVASALVEADMDIEKACKILKLPKPEPSAESKEKLTVQECLLMGFILGGIRETATPGSSSTTTNASPLSSPNFREAKTYYDMAFEKHGFTMAAVQLGSFYWQEFKAAGGANCLAGEDPEKISAEYYEKAAKAGNPMGMHKLAWHYDQSGDWHKALEWYEQAADCGYPDSAHNVAMIYQEGSQKVEPKIEVNIPLALEFYLRGLNYGYGPSATQLGKLYFQLAGDSSLRSLLPETDRAYSDDPKEYLTTAISYFDQAATLCETDALLTLGMIYGSKDLGMYDIERAQNLFELALLTSEGGKEPFEYLIRTLNARRTLIQGKEEKKSKADEPNADGLRTCSMSGCQNVETSKGEFKRCAGCKKMFYCSRACQVNDWKQGHKNKCNK
ncbi:hypothetical protein DFQ27_008382 [Actinomortierella ambigua]|uniref:MYND-type domain-containing protein n=1 Tax=Actinomortierella ambigua TaxID=1343610 RepID=A0A9P6QP57_9FUNG|nr:hypothetical protein DFQ27_008382 [Actinomortierella ambigua]